jgi:hypothetical protein
MRPYTAVIGGRMRPYYYYMSFYSSGFSINKKNIYQRQNIDKTCVINNACLYCPCQMFLCLTTMIHNNGDAVEEQRW